MVKDMQAKGHAGEAYRYTFTVFTPTYNRASTLSRVYESLKAQTYHDFEWLVVDDGSTDGTRELVEGWQQADFPIRYIWQENQGKHIAFNLAVEHAQGALFLVLDSDDACVPTALERFYAHWQAIPPQRRQEYAGVTALCQDLQGRLVGTLFPADVFDSNSLEIRFKYGMRGEKWGFQRTEVLRKFPYPAVPKTHVQPGLVWQRIAQQYRTRYVNEVLRLYDVPPQSGREWRSGAARRAPGALLFHQLLLNEHLRWCRHAPRTFLMAALSYSRYGFYLHKGLGEQWLGLRGWAKFLWLLCLPAGWGIYWVYDRRQRTGRAQV
jgi:glycosyltransferase involved in cell wall biosynthesis